MNKNSLRALSLALVAMLMPLALSAQAAAPAAGATKLMGSIRNISGSHLTLAADQGGEVAVQIQDGARLLRPAPGQTDLKGATVIQLGDLQTGDRVLVRGKLADDGKTVLASAVISMKQQDLAQWKQQQLLDWQRRSVGGLVKQVDAATGSITLSVGSRTVTVTTTPKTSYKRYAPDSVKWEDVKDATLGEIRVGDQLRAKGNKSEDGSQLTAEEVVAGTFRNLSGLITAVDPMQGNITIQDLASKKPVTVHVSADSQMKKLSPQLAQGLAMRLKGGAAVTAAPAAEGQRKGGDLNQLLSRLPAASLNDLQKGDAVMIVSTQGSAAQPPVAVTLLGGVDALLTAAPNGGAQSFLTPWSLASAPAGGDQ